MRIEVHVDRPICDCGVTYRILISTRLAVVACRECGSYVEIGPDAVVTVAVAPPRADRRTLPEFLLDVTDAMASAQTDSMHVAMQAQLARLARHAAPVPAPAVVSAPRPAPDPGRLIEIEPDADMVVGWRSTSDRRKKERLLW